MKKIILISFFIVVNLYSDTKYYLDYKDDNIIKTTELTKEKYLKTKYNLDYYKNTTKRVKWTYNKGKDYDILKVYKIEQEQEKTVKKELKIEPRKIEKKEVKESYKFNFEEINKHREESKKQDLKRNQKTPEKIEQKSYFTEIFLFILIIYFLRKMTIRNKNKVKNEDQEIGLKREEKESKKEEEKTENLEYTELEKKRVELYNDLKYNKEIEKEEKKNLYKKINKLKTDIKKNEDLEKLNKDLNDIKKGVNNG